MVEAWCSLSSLLKGVVKEKFLVQVRAFPIAVAELVATQEQFALLSWRDGVQLLIHHITHHTRHRLADAAPVLLVGDNVGGCIEGLCGSITIDEAERIMPHNFLNEAVWDGFTTCREGLYVRKIEIGEHGQQGRWQIAEGHLLGLEQMVEFLHIVLVVNLSNDTGGSSIEENKYLHDGHIEVDAGELQHDGVVCHMEIVGLGGTQHVVGDGPVGLRHSFGVTRGARGIDEVSF